MENLTNKVTRGAAWMVLLRLSIRFIGLVSTLVLVRLLNPADFGIVAMAMVVVAGIELFAAFGFDVTLIHNQDANRDDYNTAWTLSAVLGLLSALAIALLAYPAARFYDEPRLELVFQVIAIASLLDGVKNIGLVEFRKQLQLQKEFFYQISVKISAFVVTVTLAFLYRSYWALVIGIVFSRLVSVILSYLLQSFRPRISFASFANIFRYSKWLFLNNLTTYVRLRGPDFIVGKIFGVTGLGVYSVAFEISQLPTTELIAPINRVLLPGFSKIATDLPRLRNAFLRVASVLVLVSLPTAFGLAVTAHLFTPIALGDKWLDAIPLIKILAIYGGIIAILSPISTTLLAIGRPATVVFLSGSSLAIMIPLVFIATSNFGIVGATISMALTMFVFLPINYGISARIIGLGLTDVLGIFWRPVISTLAMYLIVDTLFGDAASTAANLVLAVLSGIVAYICLSAALWLLASMPANSGETYIFEHTVARLLKRAPNP